MSLSFRTGSASVDLLQRVESGRYSLSRHLLGDLRNALLLGIGWSIVLAHVAKRSMGTGNEETDAYFRVGDDYWPVSRHFCPVHANWVY